jgi:ABC-type sugar transport system permease subunit
MKKDNSKYNLGLYLVLPAALLIFIILISPLFYTVYLSVHNADYLNVTSFKGIENYIKIFSDVQLMKSIAMTFYISIVGLIISMGLGTILALWVDKKNGKFAYALQIVGLVPWVTSMVVGGLLWKWILDPDLGLCNYVLRTLNLPTINIYQTGKTALWAVIIVMAWRTIGYAMVMILAGLKGIPYDLIEAGSIDGASKFQIFTRIKFPLIKTPIMISSIVLFMSNFNNVTIPMVLTGGGPGNATTVTSLELYRMAFSFYKFGDASALSFIVFAINAILTLVYIKAVKYDV